MSVRRPGSREHVCSGILIDRTNVLTAAHCVDPDSLFGTGPRPVLHVGATDAEEIEDRGMEVIIRSQGACWKHLVLVLIDSRRTSVGMWLFYGKSRVKGNPVSFALQVV